MIMKIEFNDLKKLFYGAIQFQIIDEYLAFYRFTQNQIENMRYDQFYFDRTKFSASICIGFETVATKFSFAYKIVNISLRDSFYVYVNKKLMCSKSEEELPNEGILTFSLPEGQKEVELYFPVDAEIRIKAFCIDGNWSELQPKDCKVLWIGDSITQGAGSFSGGCTYVNIVTRTLNYHSLNQGLGGYKHDPHILLPLHDFSIDKIIVSLGTNDWLKGLNERMSSFYQQFFQLYPNIPTLIITPIWRADSDEKVVELQNIKNMIESFCGNKAHIKIVDGFELVPHQEIYFWDKLHPNALGMESYAQMLINKIRALNF